MYIPAHFSIEELVPPLVYEQRGERAWQLLDDRLLMTIDAMRDRFGAMVINTWHSKKLQKYFGYRQYSGLRTVGFYMDVYGDDRGYEKYFNSYSQHKYGRAFDALFAQYEAEEVRRIVREEQGRFPYLRAMENNVSWFHGDIRNVKPLMEFTP